MKNIKNIIALLVVALVGLSLTACSNDDLDTNQYQQGVNLNAFGPNPVLRGGTLRFVGSNLDQIASIQIPGVSAITNYEVVKTGIPSEIRITVPKDGPEVGFITLTTKTNQTITTKSELSYTEDIEFEGFSPASVMPGDVVTIKGDYLNLIYSLAFADGVIIGESDFIDHDRYSITVTVPDNAKTGKIELYTADLTATSEDNLDYQIISSKDAIEIGVPSVSKLKGRNEVDAMGNITAKARENITLTGTYLNIAEAVKVGGYEVTDIKVSADGNTLTFALPAEAPGGDVLIVCKSGVEVPVGTLTTVKPSNLSVAPSPVKAGNVLTVNGADLDLVTSVMFPLGDGGTVEGGQITVAADKVVVRSVPDTAVDGDIQLVMANGESVTTAFTLVKPTVTGYNTSTASAGGVLVINGTNLDLVKTVKFGEGSDVVNVQGTANSINLTVPMNAVSGTPTLTLANGTTVANVPEIKIEEAVFCYATALPGDDAEIKAGSSMTLNVANGDKLTGVEINGTTCQYVLADGNQLIVGIPDNAGKNAKVRLISSNGEISYTIDFIPNTELTTVLWTGAVDLGNWTLNWQIGDGTNGASNPKMFEDMELQVGDVIRVYISPYKDWWQVQFFDGHWGGQSEIGNASGLNNGNNINSGIYNLDEHGGYIELIATEELVRQLTTVTDWGYCWIIQGESVVVTKITVTHYTILEQTLWSGDVDFNNWEINWQIGDGTNGASNPNLFVDAELKEGMTIRVYINPYNDWWQVQFFDGHWGKQSEIGNATGLGNGNNVNSGIYNLEDHNGAIEIKATAAMVEQLTTLTDWGYCWILQGEGCRATKITVE